jgi:hypothetical protein
MDDPTYHIERIVKRAEQEPEFRSHLIADPKAAVERELGITVPPEVTIKVIEQQAHEYHIVLPAEDVLPLDTREPRFKARPLWT